MYDSARGPVPQHFQRQAKVLDDLTLDSFDLAIRAQRTNETRYPVDCRPQPALAFTHRLFSPLALGQIEHEDNTLLPAFCEQRDTNKHGNAAPVFSKVFLLKELSG